MSSPEKKMQNRRSFFKKRKEKENRASDHVSEAASPNGFPVLSLFLRCTRMRVEMSSRFSRQRLASQRRLQERERESAQHLDSRKRQSIISGFRR